MPQDGHGNPNRTGHEQAGSPSAWWVPKPSADGFKVHATTNSPPLTPAAMAAHTMRCRTALGVSAAISNEGDAIGGGSVGDIWKA
jgi:hypothetical protein